MPKIPPKFIPVFIQGGYYSVDQLADHLLAACHRTPDSPPVGIEAKKALTRAIRRARPPRDRYDETLLVSAYAYQQMYQQKKKKKCADSTALKRVAGKRWRTLYNELKTHGLTLETHDAIAKHKDTMKRLREE